MRRRLDGRRVHSIGRVFEAPKCHAHELSRLRNFLWRGNPRMGNGVNYARPWTGPWAKLWVRGIFFRSRSMTTEMRSQGVAVPATAVPATMSMLPEKSL